MIWLGRGTVLVHHILLDIPCVCYRGIQYQTWEKENKVFPEDEVWYNGIGVLFQKHYICETMSHVPSLQTGTLVVRCMFY